MCTRFVLGFNVETIQHKNIRFTAWDIGCREKMVKLHCHTVCRSKSTHKKTNQLLNNDLTTKTFAQMGSYQYVLAQRGFGIYAIIFLYIQFQRPLIRFYYKGTDAVIFVLDRSDEERMDELYHDILLPANLSHELDQAVYLILANKSDLNDVMSMEDITEKLRLNQLKRVWSQNFNIYISAFKKREKHESVKTSSLILEGSFVD